MTLGPSLLAARGAGRPRARRRANPLSRSAACRCSTTSIHFWLIHLVASAMAWIRYGTASFAYLFHPLPSMGGPRQLFPPDFGYPLWVTYAVWVGVVCGDLPVVPLVLAGEGAAAGVVDQLRLRFRGSEVPEFRSSASAFLTVSGSPTISALRPSSTQCVQGPRCSQCNSATCSSFRSVAGNPVGSWKGHATTRNGRRTGHGSQRTPIVA